MISGETKPNTPRNSSATLSDNNSKIYIQRIAFFASFINTAVFPSLCCMLAMHLPFPLGMILTKQCNGRADQLLNFKTPAAMGQSKC
jgi:ABC-type sugar transport system permease subunit